MDYYLYVLGHYATFTGRARRAEYWMFTLVSTVIIAVLYIVGAVIGLGSTLVGLYGLAVLVPTLGVGARRLHDINRSGWWLLIGLVPILGALALLVMSVEDGTRGKNKYGHDPKGPDLTCPHASLVPHWDLDVEEVDALLVGELLELEDEAEVPAIQGEHLNHFVCEACGRNFTREEAAAIREAALSAAAPSIA